MDNLNTNLFGVMNVTSALLPLLKKGTGKQIFGISSTCGSIGGPFGENSLGTACKSCMHSFCRANNDSLLDLSSDCISKVALNMYNRKLSRELEQVSSATPFFLACLSACIGKRKQELGRHVLTCSIWPGWLRRYFRELLPVVAPHLTTRRWLTLSALSLLFCTIAYHSKLHPGYVKVRIFYLRHSSSSLLTCRAFLFGHRFRPMGESQASPSGPDE